MKPPLDALGNPLDKDQVVGIKLGDQFLRGKITQYSPGGLLVAGSKGNPQMTPGFLTIEVAVTIRFTPGAQIGEIYRLIDPDLQGKLEEIVNEAKESA